jgi:hypothetical protein
MFVGCRGKRECHCLISVAQFADHHNRSQGLPTFRDLWPHPPFLINARAAEIQIETITESFWQFIRNASKQSHTLLGHFV